MAPWLSLDSLLSSEIDNGNQGTLYKQLKNKNDEELKKLQDKIEDAETNLGETELSDALRAKASYLAKIGEKVRPPSIVAGIIRTRVLTALVCLIGQGHRSVRIRPLQTSGVRKQD